MFDRLLILCLLGYLIYLPSTLFTRTYESSLVCHRAQNSCQLFNKQVAGTNIERFPVKALVRADSKPVSSFVPFSSSMTLRTTQSDKAMTSSSIDTEAGRINSFISNNQQEILQLQIYSSGFLSALWVLLFAVPFTGYLLVLSCLRLHISRRVISTRND